MRNEAETPSIVPPAASMMKFQKLSCPCGQKYRCRTTVADVYVDRAIDRAIATISSFSHSKTGVFQALLKDHVGFLVSNNGIVFAVPMLSNGVLLFSSSVTQARFCLNSSSRYVSQAVWMAKSKMRQIRQCHEIGRARRVERGLRASKIQDSRRRIRSEKWTTTICARLERATVV